MSNVKKWIALVMAALMIATAVPFGVFAAEENICSCELRQPVAVPAKAPTCTEDGYTEGFRCANCGKSITTDGLVKINKLEHAWVAGTPVPVTCTTDGYTPYSCSRCTETKRENVVKKLGHKYEVTDSEEATCNEAGFKKYICSVCGDNYSDTIPAKNHKYVSTVVAPTCTEEGKTRHVCSVCGDTYEDSFKQKLGHDLGEWKVTQEGTCTVNQVKERACSRCNYKEPDVNEATGHDYKETETTATCTEPGKTTYTCSKCNDSYESDFVQPLGHLNFDDKEVPATCTESGLSKGRHCTRCDKVFVEQKVIPATGHKEKKIPPVSPTCQKEGTSEKIVCEYCNTVLKESTSIPKTGHKFTTEDIIGATCTSDGVSRNICEYCELSQTVVVEKLGHSYKAKETVAATCTESGTIEYRCVRCDEKQKDKADQTVAPRGHKWKSEWTVDRAATCTKDGLKSHHCSVCGAQNDITAIPKGHKYQTTVVKAATTSKAGQVRKVCKVCSAKQAATAVAKIKSIALSKTAYYYDGTAKKPLVIIKDANGKKLVNGTDYTVKYATGRKKVGSYKVTVTFKGKYAGSKVLTFKIKLAKVTGIKATPNNKANTVKLTYKKVSGAQKYIIYYSTSKTGTFKKLGTATKLSFTSKALKADTYYFRVRAFTKNNVGKNSYSDKSSTITAKVK